MDERRIFSACPMCSSREIVAVLPSIEKDMSLSGYRYVECGDCGSFYEDTVTSVDLDEFYSNLGPYMSGSAKEEIVRDLCRHLQLSGKLKVLDLGCGSGAWSLPFLKVCAEMVCVDLNASALASLQGGLTADGQTKVSVVCSPSHAYLESQPNESFDVVLSMFSLEHDTDPRALMSEIRRVLRSGGKSVVLVPSADALQVKLFGSGFYWFQAPWHTFIPSDAGLQSAAESAGFSACRAFVPSCKFYSWFWMRALSDRLKFRSKYDRLRRYRWFINVDIAIDKLLDRLSWFLGRPSCRFFILTR